MIIRKTLQLSFLQEVRLFHLPTLWHKTPRMSILFRYLSLFLYGTTCVLDEDPGHAQREFSRAKARETKSNFSRHESTMQANFPLSNNVCIASFELSSDIR